MQDLKDAVKRKPSFLMTMRAVMWSFLGIRKSKDFEQDANKLNPVHLVIAGVLGAMIFIATLLLIVSRVVAK